MQELILGDKSNFALSAEVIDNSTLEGYLFLHIAGKKFGYSESPYGLEAALSNVAEYFHVEQFDSKNLFDCPASILINAYRKCFEEEVDPSELDVESASELKLDDVNDYYLGFYDDFLKDDRLDNCVVRTGNYLLDGFLMLAIPENKNVRFVIYDKKSGVVAEAVVVIDTFESYASSLLSKLKNK
ncbi:hypothetical protein [Gallaecimonas sp. GXIMD4217]|uniref:hypothetical protein n=1 Tax=Gallaecimonas sp. GXIMD4217 TaxID=3131927 RepID=UPI00311AC0DC